MPDKEKVIYSIERCLCHVPDACRDCDYDGYEYNKCVEKLLLDAAELLKEQEPVTPIYKSDMSFCGACRYAIPNTTNYCHHCGRKVKWDG